MADFTSIVASPAQNVPIYNKPRRQPSADIQIDKIIAVPPTPQHQFCCDSTAHIIVNIGGYAQTLSQHGRQRYGCACRLVSQRYPLTARVVHRSHNAGTHSHQLPCKADRYPVIFQCSQQPRHCILLAGIAGWIVLAAQHLSLARNFTNQQFSPAEV